MGRALPTFLVWDLMPPLPPPGVENVKFQENSLKIRGLLGGLSGPSTTIFRTLNNFRGPTGPLKRVVEQPIIFKTFVKILTNSEKIRGPPTTLFRALGPLKNRKY